MSASRNRVIHFHPGAIEWAGEGAPIDRRCPVCGDDGPHHPLLDVPELEPPHAMRRLLRCCCCASAFYDPPGIRDFTDLGGRGDEFWRFYAEIGGGVWETIWPLLMDQRSEPRSLLDVGCGFGFALDFWCRAARGSAEGVELADYGRIGAKMLGVTIHSELLEECSALAGRRFDIVYASEVIEHVDDPGAFAALLVHRLADEGVLVMTTPCASFVARENVSPTLLAALAPGFHGFLLSEDAFAETARRAGLPFVEVRRFNERMVLWASRKPLQLAVDAESARPAYFDYMAQRFALPDDAGPVWQGYAYRYLRDVVNTGKWATAKTVAMRLAASVQHSHGPGILEPENVVPELVRARTLAEVGVVGPYFLPSLYYFLGGVAHHVDRDAQLAERLYSGAAAAIVACAGIDTIFYLESISHLWPARRAAAQMQLANGRVAEAVHALIDMADTAHAASAANGYWPAERGFIDASLPPIIRGLSARGHDVSSRILADAYRRFRERDDLNASANA